MLVLLPFQWDRPLSGIGLGPLDFDLALQVLVLWTWVQTPVTLSLLSKRFLPKLRLFHSVALAYFIWLALSLLWARNPLDGLGELIFNLRSPIYYVALAAHLFRLSSERISRTVYLAVPLSIILFIGFGAYVIKTQAPNLGPGVGMAVASGDPSRIMWVIVNFKPGIDYRNPASSFITTSVKNQMSAALTLMLVLFFAFGACRISKKHLLPSLVVLTLCPVLSLSLLSRSNFFALVVGVAVAFLLYLVHPESTPRGKLIAFLTVLGITLTASVPLFITGKGQTVLRAVTDRYASSSDDIRGPHYRAVMTRIRSSSIWGYGIGTSTEGFYGAGSKLKAVHNFFLGSWLELGLVGLFLSACFYLSLCLHWLRTALSVLLTTLDTYKLNTLWIPSLLVSPLIRLHLMGGDGRPQPVDAVALAFFVYAVGRMEHFPGAQSLRERVPTTRKEIND